MNKDGIRVKGLRKSFGAVTVLHDLSFRLPTKGLVTILGSSGCGKTTLLNILSGIDGQYEGDINIMGKRVSKRKEDKRRRYRLENVGYVFQNFSLLELETSLFNVMLPLDAIYGDKYELKKKKAFDLLNGMGVGRKANQLVNTLSGGEKQRVAIARSLANDPKILFCDEPTGALDERNAERIYSLLQSLGERILVIVVSHDRSLAEIHSSIIIDMKDGRIEDVERPLKQKTGRINVASLTLKQKRTKPRVSWFYLFAHAFHLMKEKKWRSLIAESFIATGLCGFGLATYVSSSISGELNNAFASLVPPSALVMGPRGGCDSPLGAIYACGYQECEYAVAEYGDMVVDYGTDLHMDYESWFVDENYFDYQAHGQWKRLKEFSIRNINDFQWFDQLKSPICYPRTPVILRDDQVILGLPYDDMFNMCLDLQILRNYQSLGEYIDSKGLDIILHLRNDEYAFDDQEIFSVFGVIASPRPCFYHLDHRWNHHIIIDQMRFRSTLSEETPNPQYIFEIPYLTLSVPNSEFIHLARSDPNLEHLVYDPAGFTYLPTLCPGSGGCDINRLYLYGADKTGVSFATLDECMEVCPSIQGRTPITNASYYADTTSLTMGFIGKFYICRDLDAATEVVDEYSYLPKNVAFLPGKAMEYAKDGSYFGQSNGGIRISTDLSGVPVEEMPMSDEECVLSEELYEAWGRPDYVYVAAEVGGEEVGSSYARDISIGSMKVTGTKKSDYDTFFVISDWSVDFFLDYLHVPSFSLEPTGAVFSFANQEEAERGAKILEANFSDYVFAFPSKEIADSISSTLKYIGLILTIFSCIALTMSALLFLIVMTISMSESQGEERLFVVLGISKMDIARSYYAQCFLYSVISVTGSLAMLVISMIVSKRFIAGVFGAKVGWSLPYEPILALLLASASFLIIIFIGISLRLTKKT